MMFLHFTYLKLDFERGRGAIWKKGGACYFYTGEPFPSTSELSRLKLHGA